MSLIETTCEIGSVFLPDPTQEFRDTLLRLSGPTTVKAGTLLRSIINPAPGADDESIIAYAPFSDSGPDLVADGVLTYDFTAGSAGDFAVQVLVKGSVIQRRLIIWDGGTVHTQTLDALDGNGIRVVRTTSTSS